MRGRLGMLHALVLTLLLAAQGAIASSAVWHHHDHGDHDHEGTPVSCEVCVIVSTAKLVGDEAVVAVVWPDPIVEVVWEGAQSSVSRPLVAARARGPPCSA